MFNLVRERRSGERAERHHRAVHRDAAGAGAERGADGGARQDGRLVQELHGVAEQDFAIEIFLAVGREQVMQIQRQRTIR